MSAKIAIFMRLKIENLVLALNKRAECDSFIFAF